MLPDNINSNAVALTGDYASDLDWGKRIYEADTALQFIAGDYVLAMSQKYEVSQRSLSKDLADTLGRPWETLRRYAQVSAAIPPGKRSPNLPYSHHIKAAVADNPQAVLQQAEADGLSVRDTERLARGLPLGGEVEAQAQSSAAVQGASLEESAVQDVKNARLLLERAAETLSKPGFRLTVPVGQALHNHLAEASVAFLAIEKACEDEVGPYLSGV